MRLDPNAAVFDELPTPALVLDVAALERNIARMAAHAAAAGVALRPHAKTHKCVEIARRQQDAGAIGIACATLPELEAMAAGGLGGLLLSSAPVGRWRIGRLVAAHLQQPLASVVDHPDQVAALAQALPPHAAALPLLVDIDVGQGRAGVIEVGQTLQLARCIAQQPRLRLAGLQGFAGQAQHLEDPLAREAAAREVGAVLKQHGDALTSAGFAVETVSGSGTGTAWRDAAAGVFTELQVGSYAVMDADYARIAANDPQALPFETALYVLATVVGVQHPGQVSVDAGTKALAVNGPQPHRLLGLPGSGRYRFAGDEHGVIKLDGAPPTLGQRVLIAATHCDPTVNLHARYAAQHDDGSLQAWPVVGRHGERIG